MEWPIVDVKVESSVISRSLISQKESDLPKDAYGNAPVI